MYLWAICISSLEKCYLYLLPAFLLGWLEFLNILSSISCLYILDINTLLVASFKELIFKTEIKSMDIERNLWLPKGKWGVGNK